MMMMMMIMIMMMNCFCGMVDQRKALNLISKWNHYQRSSPSRISDMPRTGFQPTQSLSSGLVEWSCPVVITTTPRRHKNKTKWNLFSTYFNSYYSVNPSHRCRIWKRPTKVSKNQYVVTLLSLIFIFWTPCSCLPYVSYCCTNDSHIFGHVPSEKC